ncbi:zinc-dependent metalloprotease family protein [Pseudomonas alkylphenolica]|uniref:zinc-dependent metalloprotease family protein n=1 Tax=Pseudomonas alkylphenolica TaxID=237609 RepID=UPI0018D78231|nr:zinc-dependent metalloprotease family protein [Pseudomonas alkylphenolica]MBH3429094.1 metallopeptidase [Pseudomonas alkylphenolica]
MMHGKWKSEFLIVASLLLTACTSSSHAAMDETGTAAMLFERPAADTQAMHKLLSTQGIYPSLSALLDAPSTEKAWEVKVNPALIDAGVPALSVPSPEGDVVRFDLTRFSDVAAMSGWIGDVVSDRKQRFTSAAEVDFDPFNWISLVRDGDELTGDIHIKGKLYRLEPVGAGRHVLIKVDESRMPPNGEPVLKVNTVQTAASNKAQKPAHSTIRVLFVTSNERRAVSPNYRAALVQALQNANQYLINSHVPLTYELAGFFAPDYSEANKSQWAMLQEMAGPNTALAREVYVHRDALRADLVSLFNTNGAVCGNAFGWSTKATGYNTISCTVALAHELGHNLGGGHGLEVPDPTKHYNHGYRHRSPNFHTIQVTSHGAIPYFSNPRLEHQGVPIGTVQNHDVARQFDDYRTTVENFYPPMLMSITVFDNVNMQGNRCTFDIQPAKRVTLIEEECGASWTNKVWSAKVTNMTEGATLRLGNAFAWHTYISTSYSGDFDVPTLTGNVHDVPEGMTLQPNSGNLTKRISQVEILKQ